MYQVLINIDGEISTLKGGFNTPEGAIDYAYAMSIVYPYAALYPAPSGVLIVDVSTPIDDVPF
jgi:hypothetical protein